MASSYSSFFSLLLHALLLLQVSFRSQAREIVDRYQKEDHIRIYGQENQDHHHHQLEPALNVFFTVKDLYLGKTMPVYFAINNPSTTPHLLPREQADSIPFSFSKLPYLLEFFGFSSESPQAKAMEHTLGQCELEPTGGEIKFCVTSLESMLDSTLKILGTDKLEVLTTKIHPLPDSNHTVLQTYTFMKEPLEIFANTQKIMACHKMAYPYAVFYCHGHKSHNRLFKIALDGANGEKVDAIGICHMDTSSWDRDHVAFRVLGGQPGSSPVCHFMPADNVVWVASP